MDTSPQQLFALNALCNTNEEPSLGTALVTLLLPWPWQLSEGRVYFGLWFQRSKSLSWWESVASSGGWNKKAKSSCLNPEHEAERANQRSVRLFILNLLPQWCTSSSRAVPPKPPQTVPPTGNQAYEGHFIFKPQYPQDQFVTCYSVYPFLSAPLLDGYITNKKWQRS